jgi:hypothetical protein
MEETRLRTPLRDVYDETVKSAQKSAVTTGQRHDKLKQSFVCLLSTSRRDYSLRDSAVPTLTVAYRKAMQAQADGWAKFRIKVCVGSGLMLSLLLSCAVLSRRAARWRNGLTFCCGGCALFTFAATYKAVKGCYRAQKGYEDEVAGPLFDVYSYEERGRLAQAVREEGLTKAIDQFVGQDYVTYTLRSTIDGTPWIIKTLAAKHLLSLNYNLFDIEESKEYNQVDKLWELQAMAMGYVAAKHVYKNDPTGRGQEFATLCSEINETAKHFIPNSA